MTALPSPQEANTVTALWGWLMAGTGTGAAMGILVRTSGYLLREHIRSRAMTAMARELAVRGGQAEVSDQDGTTWSVRLDTQEPQ
ncbi:hypothetical protein ABZT23_31895 [Streptomyces sp. NPDC005386]|uniref:hypothetical protein n=1 Tax=unclassified Streptomyces TaxID=2593676 RepID=UPI00332CF18B